MGELCGFCQSVVNPGAVVCASCGAYKRRKLRPWMGVLILLLLAVGLLYLHLLPIVGLSLIGAGIFTFVRGRRLVWWRRF
jgi:hypothetical protein